MNIILEEWTESRVLQLIKNGVQESLNLDYKKSDSLQNTDGKKNELCKDVTAFANSAGGILIYGVAENGHSPTEIDDGIDPNVISKEWIEQIINSKIQRRIPDIKISQIQLSSNPGRVIYVIDIPQSVYAPHMAPDKRFYKRFNFQSVPMEEYEIRDVSNRFIAPDLNLNISMPVTRINFSSSSNWSNQVTLNLSLSNNSTVPAEYTVVELNIDSRLQFTCGLTQNGEQTFDIDDQTFNTKLVYSYLSIPNEKPILHGINFEIPGSPLMIRFPNEPRNYFIMSKLTSPGMTQKLSVFMLKFDGEHVEISSKRQ